MKLHRLHPDSSLNKSSLDYWRKQTTERIVESLLPGRRDSLKVKAGGIIMDGNTRIKVLEDRGYGIEALAFEKYP